MAVYVMVSCQPSSALTEDARIRQGQAFFEEAWPLPRPHPTLCPGNVDAWQARANRLLSLAPIHPHSIATMTELEVGIVKNALISANYARLYLRNRASQSVIYDYWMGIAAQSSAIVGHKIRAVYRQNYYAPAGLAMLLRSDAPITGLQGLLLSAPSAGRSIARGNQAVYKDIFWQFLVAHYCGPRTVLRLIQTEMPAKAAIGGTALAHWQQLKRAWQPLAIGSEATPHSRAAIVHGTQQLIVAEQLHVLQPVMYDILSARLVNGSGALNTLAVAPLPSNGRELESFPAFARRRGQRANLGNGPLRVAWMIDFTQAQMIDLDAMAAAGTSERAYRPVFREAALILSDHLPSR